MPLPHLSRCQGPALLSSCLWLPVLVTQVIERGREVTVFIRWVGWNWAKVGWASLLLVGRWVTHPHHCGLSAGYTTMKLLRWQSWTAPQWSSTPVHAFPPFSQPWNYCLDWGTWGDWRSYFSKFVPSCICTLACQTWVNNFTLLFNSLCFSIPKAVSDSSCLTWVGGDTLWDTEKIQGEGQLMWKEIKHS